MSRAIVFWLVGALIVFACGKESSGPSSAEGKWAYTTSDGKISVTFELMKSAGGTLELQNPTIKVNGTSGIAAGLMTGVSLPAIGSIRINANDPALTYNYSITFTNGQVSGDFKRIEVPSGSYTYPWGTVVALNAVAIVRP